MTTPLKGTAEEYREMARKCHQRSAESWERSDTDGFLSQAASTAMGYLHSLEAEIVEAGGRWTFPALFDLDGNLIAAKSFIGQYGFCFGLLPDDNPDSGFCGFFSPSKAKNEETARKNNAKKGYYVGEVRAVAGAKLSGGYISHPYAYRRDGGFSRDVEIVDNGQ